MIADLERRQMEWCWKRTLEAIGRPADPNDGHLYQYDDETRSYGPMAALDMSWMDE